MFHRSKIFIDKTMVASNLDFLRSMLGKQTELCGVVKANAYGHGIEVYPPLLEELGVSTFAVSSAEEAYQLKPLLSQQCRLIVMSRPPREALKWLIENDIEFYLFSPSFVPQISRLASELRSKAKVHIELETGLYRTGVQNEQMNELLCALKEHSTNFYFSGICTHLAGAEERANRSRIHSQIELFEESSNWVMKELGSQIPRHAACSAAIICYPEAHYDMVRAGVSLYGFWSTKEVYEQYLSSHTASSDPLRQVLTWKTRIESLQTVPAGKFVGYGTSFKTWRETHTAIVPVGYSDGLSRRLSNLGYVLVREKRAPLIGVINMNSCIVDITDIEGVQIGDEVVLSGSQGDERLLITSFSDLILSLNYESLVKLSMRIPRQVV